MNNNNSDYMDIFSPAKAVSSSSDSNDSNINTPIKDSDTTNIIINGNINNKVENNIDINIEDTNNSSRRNSIIINNNDSNIDSNSSNSLPDTTTSNFQHKVLENVINECLEDFKTSLHRDIMDMHVELIRQFHIQQNSIEGMLKCYCNDMNELREEVKRLKEENNLLKKKISNDKFYL
nr:4483_t:CDS:2 [Entrophospora candida]